MVDEYKEEEIDCGAEDELCEVPMYSFKRVASMFWHGFYNRLRRGGKTKDEAIEIMQHKFVRWMLDNDTQIEDLGAKMAEEFISKPL